MLFAIAAAVVALTPVQIHAVDSMVRTTMSDTATPGVSIAIVRENRIVYTRGYGERDLDAHEPVDARTVFRWGSVSKQFAAASLTMLASQGKLSLDDPISRWFPSFTQANDIRVRDLLNQVSGYCDYYPLDYLDIEMSKPASVRAILDEYARAPLTAPPRTRWEYSNTNFTIAGALIERLTGEPIGRFYQQHIFVPLGMTSARYDEPMTSSPDRATGYNSYWLEPQHNDPVEADSWLNAAGGLAGTASDLARWDVGLMTHTILSEDQFRTFTSDRKLARGTIDTGYGFGVAVGRRNGHSYVDHGGNVIGFASYNLLLPDDHTAIVVLTNSYEATPGTIAWQIADELVPALAQTRPLSKKTEKPVPSAAAKAAVDRIRTALTMLAQGTLPRSEMTADFAYLLNSTNRRRAQQSLKNLGDIKSITWLGTRHRGGLNLTGARVRFAHRSATAVMYETTDHRIAELMLFP